MSRFPLRLCVLAALLGSTVPLHAQGLRGKLTQLFTFGGAQQPLLLLSPANAGGASNAVVPNDGFLPDASQANAAVLAFLDSWMRGTVASAPIGSVTGGASFSFGGGTPMRTTVSPGPVVGEIGRTLGRGRTVVGVTENVFGFNSLRGVPLTDIRFNFTHGNACSGAAALCPEASTAASASDVVELRLSLDYNLAVTSLFANHGLTDRIDVGVVVPVVHTSLSGTSTAQVIPYSAVGDGRVATFISGTPDNPVLTSSQSTSGSATGIGDVAIRAKARLSDDGQSQLALLGELRLPTGKEDDLLGAGSTSGRVLGIASTRFGSFAPYANVGYRYWSGSAANDAVQGTLGFDQLLSPNASFSAALVSELQVGASVFQLPDAVSLPAPFARTIQPAEIPDIRDNAVSAALGFKFVTQSGLVAILNGMVPVQRGGPRPDLALTAGVQYAF